MLFSSACFYPVSQSFLSAKKHASLKNFSFIYSNSLGQLLLLVLCWVGEQSPSLLTDQQFLSRKRGIHWKYICLASLLTDFSSSLNSLMICEYKYLLDAMACIVDWESTRTIFLNVEELYSICCRVIDTALISPPELDFFHLYTYKGWIYPSSCLSRYHY